MSDDRPRYEIPDEPEIWRPIPQHEMYEVSTLGRIRYGGVRRKKMAPGHILKPMGSPYGYCYVHLRAVANVKKTVMVHGAVCAAFLGGWPADRMKITPAHWDGDKKNNRLSNLRWATRPDNYFDKLRHGRATHGERNGFAVVTDEQVTELRAERAAGAKLQTLSAKYGISVEQVSRIARGLSRKLPAYYEPVAVEDYFAARA